MNKLTELANYYGTDKGTKSSRKHGYTQFYEKYFESFRNESISLLEIGVDAGASLLMWADYFPKGKIFGFDLAKSSPVFHERIKYFSGDQSEYYDIARMMTHIGLCDIIIDDGSHVASHQQMCLFWLWPFLLNQKYYIIEDLHTKRKDDLKFDERNSIDTLDLIKGFLKNKEWKTFLWDDEFKTMLTESIEEIKLYKDKTCIIKRK